MPRGRRSPQIKNDALFGRHNGQSVMKGKRMRAMVIGLLIVIGLCSGCLTTARRDAVNYKGHWYKFFDEQVTFEEAKQRCKTIGGHLVYVNDAAENSFVFDLTLGRSAWIGAWLKQTPREWCWLDGTKMEYQIWNEGQPQDDWNQPCATIAFRRTEKWEDHFAGYKTGFVCEWDK